MGIVGPDQYAEKRVHFEEEEKGKLRKLQQEEDDLQLQNLKKQKVDGSSGLSSTDDMETGSDENEEDNMTMAEALARAMKEFEEKEAAEEEEMKKNDPSFYRLMCGTCPICFDKRSPHGSLNCPKRYPGMRMWCDLCRDTTCSSVAEHRRKGKHGQMLMFCTYCKALGEHWTNDCPNPIDNFVLTDSDSDSEGSGKREGEENSNYRQSAAPENDHNDGF